MLFNRKQNRKWQERRQLYKGKFYYLKKLAQTCLVISAIVGVFALVIYFRNSDALTIRSIDILGEFKRVSKEEILLLSEIKPSDRLFNLSLSRVQQNVLRHHWVQEVRVRREFPDKIQIHITEKEPVALLNVGSLYLVDVHGQVFKKFEPGDPQNLPVLSGFNKEELTKYPRLMRSYFEFTMQFLNFLKDAEFYSVDPVSEIHFDRVAGFTVYTQNSGMEIFYGRDDYMLKQRKLEKFKTSEFYEQKNFIRLDLDSDQKVIARQWN